MFNGWTWFYDSIYKQVQAGSLKAALYVTPANNASRVKSWILENNFQRTERKKPIIFTMKNDTWNKILLEIAFSPHGLCFYTGVFSHFPNTRIIFYITFRPQLFKFFIHMTARAYICHSDNTWNP